MKGGFRQALWRHVVFTSNSSPVQWYPNVLAIPERVDSFHRRIHNIIHLDSDGYSIQKGHLPFAAPAWLKQKTVNQVLMNPQNQSTPLSEENARRRLEWLERQRKARENQ